jgi:hypothetical protein
MPSYRPLSSSFDAPGADIAREAESLSRRGDVATAITHLEEALAISRSVAPEIPAWLCGRLAVLYRAAGRYDDEVRLLEDFSASQSREDMRIRYQARLSKARTIADRKRRSSAMGALASVRAIVKRPSRAPAARDGDQGASSSAEMPRVVSDLRLQGLSDLYTLPTDEAFDNALDMALAVYCAGAAAQELAPADLVTGARMARARAREAGLDPALCERRGDAVMLGLMSLLYGRDSE